MQRTKGSIPIAASNALLATSDFGTVAIRMADGWSRRQAVAGWSRKKR
jgi:hypothetical protein